MGVVDAHGIYLYKVHGIYIKVMVCTFGGGGDVPVGVVDQHVQLRVTAAEAAAVLVLQRMGRVARRLGADGRLQHACTQSVRVYRLKAWPPSKALFVSLLNV